MVELLAPAGNKEALTAAVESGADAVYLSGKMFGARQSAANFTDAELAEAIKFAHLRGVLVYVTVNTLIDNSEIPLLADYLKYLYQTGADAVIVQDLGAARLARAIIPAMPLHASTQMTAHNLEGVKLLGEMGFKRIILAREVPLAEIESICRGAAASKIEIETFVHGALCISYSGQCLMSSLIGGRSGNRGRCAQPCRLPYTLVDSDGNNILEKVDVGEYLLSPKDLNTLAILPQLIGAGIVSLKIEGRMKRPEYVAVVVDAYRRAVDSLQKGAPSARGNIYHVPVQDQKDVAQIFNRDFTTAYLLERPGRDMMSDRRPNNRGVMAGRVQSYNKIKKTVTIRLTEPLAAGDIIEIWVKVGGRVNIPVSTLLIEGKEIEEKALPGDVAVLPCPKEVRPHDRVFKVFDKKLDDRAKTFFAGQTAGQRKIFADVEVSAREGEPLTVKIKDADGFTAEAKTEFLAQRAVNRPLVPETVAKQIQRLGTTIFRLRNLTINIEGEIMVPVSEINEVRRQAAEKLAAARLEKFSARPPLLTQSAALLPAAKNVSAKQPQLAVNTDDLPKLRAALSAGADVVFFGAENYAGTEIKKEDYQTALETARQANKKIIFNTPRIINARQMEELSELITYFRRLCPDAVGAANTGVIYLLRQNNLPIHGDYPLNIYNSLSAEVLAELGLNSLTLSPELNFAQIEEIRSRTDIVLETLAHGRLTLMVSEYCVAGSFLTACAKSKNKKSCPQSDRWLRDRAGEKFPVVTDQYCRMHVLNAKETSMLPYVERLCRSGIDRIRIEGKYMDAKTVGQITGFYRELLDNKDRAANEAAAKNAESANITRSHYFRGLL